MAEKPTIPDDHKEISTSNIPSSKTEQGPEVNRQTTDTDESRGYESKPVKDKKSGKVPGSLTEVAKEGKNAIRKTFSFGDQQNKSNGNFRIIRFNWIYYPCLFNIYSSYRRTTSINSRYYIYCCINWVFYIGSNNC